jgi:hypothetical protein
MARFGSTVAFVVNGRKYKAGQTYADTVGSAVGNDVVWVGLDSTRMSPGLIPLDAGATSMIAGSRFAGTTPYRIDGANSID